MVLALLDASVLVPAPLFDTLLTLGTYELFRPGWTEAILDEVQRALSNDLRLDPEQIQRRLAQMMESFPTSTVAGYQPLIPHMTNHPGDRHVLAAAVHAGAQIVVTNNLRHFQPQVTRIHAINALSADEFLADLFRGQPDMFRTALDSQLGRYRNPPMNLNELLSALNCPRLVDEMVLDKL